MRDWLYHGAVDVTAGIGHGGIGGAWVSSAGDIAWLNDYKIGSSPARDLFMNRTNISGPVLGDNPWVSAAAMNEAGDLVWSGRGDNTGGYMDLFLNDVNLTHDLFDGFRNLHVLDISDGGHMLWYVTYEGRTSLMRDFEDISTPVLGDHEGFPQLILGAFVNVRGDVAWVADDQTTGHAAVYLNDVDLSTAVLGKAGRIKGLDAWGRVLWEGSGESTGDRLEVFVNSFNLSQDALGDEEYAGAAALAIGENGHVLWYAGGPDHTSSLWLSTPVPEPSTLLLALPLLLLARRRRPQRDCPSC
jgi:hypothetical protein